jgi:hypothetical protein
MVDEQEIKRLLSLHFNTSGKTAISNNGRVSCAIAELKDWKKVEQLPVKFLTVTEYFTCSNNNLKSLQGSPENVGTHFFCERNQLESLEGAPKTVGANFWCHNNNLVSLQGAPSEVGGSFSCYNNPQLESLEGLPSSMQQLVLSYSPKLPLLRTLQAQNILFFPSTAPEKLLEIMNKYAGQGKRAMFDCQKELEDAGYSENARW